MEIVTKIRKKQTGIRRRELRPRLALPIPPKKSRSDKEIEELIEKIIKDKKS